MSQFDIQKQLQQQFAPLYGGFTGTLSPKQMAEIQKAYSRQVHQQHTSEKERAANLEAFNTNLQAEAKRMGEMFALNTKDKPIEEQYRAFQQAQDAVKNQYASLSEEQQAMALDAFNEQADVFAKADEAAGFFCAYR